MSVPRVIMHNSVSLDGSITGFEVNMGLHYQIAGQYKADAHLIGSNTITQGVTLYGGEIPVEEPADFVRSKRDPSSPYWVIVDTKGTTKGMLHVCRRFELCRDVIVLVAERTGQDYIQYLEERNYRYFVCGVENVVFNSAFEILSSKLDVNTILVDSGPVMNGLLIERGLVDEISLLVSPALVGSESYNLFSRLKTKPDDITLELSACEILDKKWVWLRYEVIKRNG